MNRTLMTTLMTPLTKPAVNRAACLVAMALAASSMACAGGMKSRSPSTVHGDFEVQSPRREYATGAASDAPPSEPTASAAVGSNYRSGDVLVSQSVRAAGRSGGVESAEEADERLADNSPSSPAPKTSAPSPTVSSAPPPAMSSSSPDRLSGAAMGVRGPAVAQRAGQPPPPLPPPSSPPNSTLPKGPAPVETPNKQQLLVYTAHLQMAVYLVEPGLSAVEKIAKDFGGYLSSRGDNRIEIRVPREKFNDALKAVEATGDVLHRDVQASDVTDQYVDMESRLRNAKVIRARLQALLERAQVKEALEIERELGRVSQEIEVLEGKMKLLRDKVAFSTITVQYAPKAQALQKTAFALPFPWLSQLGLPHLLRLRDHKGDD